MQFCSNCMWVSGWGMGWITQPGKDLVKETPLKKQQESHHLGWMKTFQYGCSAVTHVPVSNTSSCPISKSNRLMSASGGTLVGWNFCLSLGPFKEVEEWTPLGSPQGENSGERKMGGGYLKTLHFLFMLYISILDGNHISFKWSAKG